MEVIEKNVDELSEYTNNPRVNKDAVKYVANSIKQFGFKVPIIIDSNNIIVAGHTRLKAAKSLRLKTVPCIVADDLTPAQIKAFRLADNKAGEMADWDFGKLETELEELAEFNIGFEMNDFGFDEIELNDLSDEEYEEKKREFREKIERGEMTEDNDEYLAFLDKFERKKTTDDCYTPDNIYEVVANYVSEHYGYDKRRFVRPFYPGGDYQKEKYNSQSIVVDNPPFSIISQICRWYSEKNIKFFLFAPTLTCMAIKSAQKIAVGVEIIYANKASVNTSFVTNMDEYEIRSAPDLYAKIQEENRKNIAKLRKVLPVFKYPKELVRVTDIAVFSRNEVIFAVKKNSCAFVRKLDSQKGKMGIFGSAYLISRTALAEREKAEIELEKQREKKQREKEQRFVLSERERKIVELLE